jgi:hypothetical protein
MAAMRLPYTVHTLFSVAKVQLRTDVNVELSLDWTQVLFKVRAGY